MKQPIYVVKKEKFDIEIPQPKDSWVYSSYFGNINSREDYIEMLNEIKFDEHGEVLVSKVMEVINKRFSDKMIAGNNGFLIDIKQSINRIREIKES